MSYTANDLTALESAIKEGVFKVKYADKEITYRTLNEMNKLRDQMRAGLSVTKKQLPRYGVTFSKGLTDES